MKPHNVVILFLAASFVAVISKAGRYAEKNGDKIELAVVAPNATRTSEQTSAPTTTAPPVLTEEEAKLEAYHRCVEAIMHNKNTTGCPRNPVKPKRLLLLVGDSTAREFGKGMDGNYDSEPYTAGVRVTKLLTYKSPIITYEAGIKVTTEIILIGLCRMDDIRMQLIKSVGTLLEEYGQPDIVYFSTGGLHECKFPFANNDPLYGRVMKRKIPKSFEKQWVRGRKKNLPIFSVGVKDYVKMQGPCFMETIRKVRLMLPSAVMVWRPFIDAKHLRSGGNMKSQRFTPRFCRNNKFWSRFRLDTCDVVHKEHLNHAISVRSMGIAVLDNDAYYPSLCTSLDSVHLNLDCQKIIGGFVTDIYRLGQQVVPEAMKVNDEVCSAGYFDGQVKRVKPLKAKDRPVKEEDGSVYLCKQLTKNS
eukprot:TRINITY_DN11060_c0_g1_i2.p1 TRINITY_DN11060_c0_g1~~TRINITY_DN11060_c0_g1_i2.p1  ORF type:complete len:416 (+),score=60.10 TRINITY_DN11060_c0_g1_i2:92-1339(+)